MSIPLIVSMLVALFTVQLRLGFSSVNTIGLRPAGPVFGPPGDEINLLYIAALVALPSRSRVRGLWTNGSDIGVGHTGRRRGCPRATSPPASARNAGRLRAESHPY